MAVYPKGTKFMASVGTGADRVRKTFKTESEALVWEQSQDAAREALKALPEAPVISSIWTLQQAVDHAFKHHWTGSGGGDKKALINAGFAIDFFGADTLISEITTKWIVEYMEEMMEEYENAPSTLNKKMSNIKVILTKALDIGGITALPRMQRYKEATRSPHWFTDHDELKMLDMCQRLKYIELHDFIILGMDTGFRRSEVLGLKPVDYHLGNLLIHADATKGKTARSVPASTDRLKTLLSLRRGNYRLLSLTTSELRKQWTELRAALGRNDDPYFIPHTMRHTCATRLISNGASLKEVQMWLGHGVIQSTMVYAHLAPGQLEEAGKKLANRKVETVETV